jgi:NADH:ubiquinone oxidoreductase subunit 5 (subunit L)/multisubunit Na+/H+ antiporter MnhA subunit
MSAPTPISSLLHSATLVVAGIYLGLRTSLGTAAYGSSLLTSTFSVIALTSLLLYALYAVYVVDLKSIIASSTVSQIGFMFNSLFLSLNLFSVFHLFIHSLFKSLLFLLSAEIIHNNDSAFQSSLTLNIGSDSASSIHRVIYNISGMSLLLSASKESILLSIFSTSSSYLYISLLFVATVCTTFYVIKLYLALKPRTMLRLDSMR